MAKFNEKTFNPEAFGKYVDRIPKTKRNELMKSRALKGTNKSARRSVLRPGRRIRCSP